MTSCSTTKDGPPRYNIDVTKIPDAVPKIEPLSKYGNMPAYNVFGKKYYVLSSSKNYKEKGTASWYGTKFHQRNTSSGEPYNMLAMTAAHKSLPLPTYVEVTNLDNGKKIIVKVNDRGPFVGNRIIDLSYAAAKKIGMTGKGTANVEIRAIDPLRNTPVMTPVPIFVKNDVAVKPKSPLPPVILAKNTGVKMHPAVYLQVGAFQNRMHAERLKKQL
ncbi:MAG TPA: septal ring lytic transglycosylase RlpA family protein, partial [Gammaproteobacteria bacterium]|nr:septal ring lytic transglycosylase RlpA family protein [Gammaproteobacteria bacterium]